MLKRNLVANLLGHGWVSLMGLIFVPIYIRYLGIEAYGVIGFFAILQNLINLLDFGMTPTLNREIARLTGSGQDATPVRDLLRTVEICLIILGALVAAAVWAASSWLATSWLDRRELSADVVTQAIVAMGLVAAMRLIEGPYRGVLLGLQRHALLNAIAGAMATLRGVGVIFVLAFWRPTIDAFFQWQLLISLLSVAVFAASSYAVLPPVGRAARFDLNSLRRVGGFAGAMFLISIAGLLMANTDKVILSRLLTLADYGYYTLAGLVASGLYMLIYPISQTWSPRLNQLHAAGDEPSFIEAYHRGAELISVLAGSAAFFVIAFSDVVLMLWTRDPIIAQKTSAILQLLLLANLLNGLMNMPIQAQLAWRWTRLALVGEIAAIVVIFPAIIVVTPLFGMEGAAWSLVALNTIYLFLSVAFMYRRILCSERWKWLFGDVLIPLASAAAAAFGSRYLLSFCPPGPSYWAVFVLGAIATPLAAACAAPSVRREWLRFAPQAFALLRI